MEIDLAQADITDEYVDAIVTPASSSLLGGSGVDAAVHRAAGPELLAACRQLGGCDTGDAKVTPGFRLHAHWIVHTVGPVWRGGGHDEIGLLAACYSRALEVADAVGATSIAFPSISTAAPGSTTGRSEGFPLLEAARIAIDRLRAYQGRISLVRIVAEDDVVFDTYQRVLRGI